ncbi:MAG: AAA family ATPase [Gammaproteobacteria bacterium]|nr:AAA family ATPase [Rhodocyclaceae bacterium]MBU3908220.1 AAA family ATPase [Gammaproteobacteria bacterium]MBU4003143.1 AAA family ATPase [Gammaproteobacteria bacterium]MBU4019985.1 AAA family ATPase [Gammaproteobacteria bacterium]MBU4096849.1 AAA family ATPase [Gammaproteobacteria bacterium]
MYLEHYGLSEAPFRITPHTDFFFTGANRGATLEALLYAITHDEGIVKVSGEVGSGKTMLCRVLMERLPEHVVTIYLANPSLSRADILYALADELAIAIPEQSRANAVMRALQEKLVSLYAAGKQVVVLIDEAHAMPNETLEEIRLLSNLESNRHKLLQLVLFGQPEINEALARSDMRQLRERITHNFGLEPLVRDDIAQYMDFRMRAGGYRGPGIFTPAAIKLITDASQGLTRRINILADKALLAAFAAGGHQIGAKEAKAAIRDSEFATFHAKGSGLRPLHALLWAGGGAIVMLAIVGAWRLVDLPAAIIPPTTLPPVAQVDTSSAGDQLPQPNQLAMPIAQTPSRSVSQSPPGGTPPERKMSKPDAPTPPPVSPGGLPPRLEDFLAESQPWLDSAPQHKWFLQLLRTVATHPELVEAFLVRAHNAGVDMGKVRVYRSSLSGTARYGVIYGEYASRKAALDDLASLPQDIKTHHPYTRQVAQLR